MFTHQNLSAHGDRRDVYAALQRDYKRDTRQIQIMDVAGFIMVVFLVRHLSGWDYIASVLFFVIVLARLNTFIDNSNRNFMMHTIDWLEARDNEPQTLA
jgi:hypothetical protein